MLYVLCCAFLAGDAWAEEPAWHILNVNPALLEDGKPRCIPVDNPDLSPSYGYQSHERSVVQVPGGVVVTYWLTFEGGKRIVLSFGSSRQVCEDNWAAARDQFRALLAANTSRAASRTWYLLPFGSASTCMPVTGSLQQFARQVSKGARFTEQRQEYHGHEVRILSAKGGWRFAFADDWATCKELNALAVEAQRTVAL